MYERNERRSFGNRPRSFGGGGGGGGFGGPRRNIVPVKEGEELDVRIEGIAEKGDGVAKKRGFVIFVPNAKQGEELHIRINKVARSVAFAESLGAAQGPIPEEEPRAERKPQDAQRSEDNDDSKSNDESDDEFDESKASEEF